MSGISVGQKNTSFAIGRIQYNHSKLSILKTGAVDYPIKHKITTTY